MKEYAYDIYHISQSLSARPLGGIPLAAPEFTKAPKGRAINMK